MDTSPITDTSIINRVLRSHWASSWIGPHPPFQSHPMRLSLSLECLYIWVWDTTFHSFSFSLWWVLLPGLPSKHLHLHPPVALGTSLPRNKPISSQPHHPQFITTPLFSGPLSRTTVDSTSHTHNTLSRSLQDWCLAWPERSCRTQLKSISPERPLPTTVSAKHPLSPSLSICILMIDHTFYIC